jgi:hypothetical protein
LILIFVMTIKIFHFIKINSVARTLFAALGIVATASSSLAGGTQQSSQSSSPNVVNLGRKVTAQTYINPLFNAAVVTRSNINLNGNNVLVDSFDSSDPLHSTVTGQYNPLLAEANGDVATDSSVVGDISLGNANVYGHLYTGPGTASGSVQIGANGAVGSVAWNATSTGIQPGYWSGDFNFNIPDVPAPPTGTNALPAPVNGNVVLNGTNYTISPTDPNISVPILVTGPVTLWVQGSYSPPGINVALTNNANLALFVGRTTGSGDSFSISSSATINQPGLARTLQLYGMASLTTITLSGNVGFVGTIYAPEANATFSGGGNNTDVSGAIVVNSLTMNGHFSIHYDQNLAVNGPSRGWIAKSWIEQRYP